MDNAYTRILFDMITAHIDLGIAVIDHQGYFIHYNQVMGEIEGLSPKEVIGKYIFNVYPSFDLSNSTLLQCLHSGKPIYNDLQSYINGNGRKIFTIVTDIPIIAEGEIIGVIEIAQDILRLKKLNQSIDNWNRLKKVNTPEQKRSTVHYQFEDFLTLDKALLQQIEKVKKMAQYDFNVLIYGETGTGKEILAQSIHQASSRKDKIFIGQNCAAIPENLLESIFFGTERGSFTGALDKEGIFEQVNGGTLLLDELNSFPVYLQAKLLRVLQERKVKRLGSSEEKTVDVRMIATVNEDPQQLILSNKLREDLFFRLSSLYIHIPPLRERKEDILFLSRHYIKQYCALYQKKEAKFSKDTAAFFTAYPWKGNVRELINVIEYIIMALDGDTKVTQKHLPYYMFNIMSKHKASSEIPVTGFYADALDHFSQKIIRDELERNRWNVSKTAQNLGLKRQTLQNKIKKLNISKEQ